MQTHTVGVLLARVQSLTAIVLLLSAHVRGEYDCLCSYSVEHKVLSSPNKDSSPFGYLYEFDCKKIESVPGLPPLFTAVAFEHRLGYVEMTSEQQHQTCQGDPPDTDTLYTTTKTAVSSTRPSTAKTTVSTSTSPTTVSSQTTTHSTTPTPLVTTTVPSSTISSTRSTPRSTTQILTSSTSFQKSSTASSSTTTTTTTTTTSTVPPSSATSKPTVMTTSTTPLPTTPSTTTPTTSSTRPSTSRLTQTSTTSTALPSTSKSTHTSTKSSSTTSATTPLTSTTSTHSPTTTTSYTHVNTSNSPLRYVGIGYDLLHGNPGGMERTMDGEDPGMMMTRRIFQLTTTPSDANDTTREVEVTMSDTCVYTNEAIIVNDGKSYQDELLRHVVFPNNYPHNLTMDAFTLDREFLRVRQETEGYSSTIYRDKLTSCYLGTFRYRDELANVSDFSVTTDFARDVCALSDTYNASQYLDFVDNWGTSIVMAVKVGTLKVASYKTNDQQLVEHIQRLPQGDTVLNLSGAFKGYASSVTVNLTVLSSLKDTGAVGSLTIPAVVGTRSNPAPIQLTLYPVTEALDPKYWTMVMHQQVCQGMDASRLFKITANMNMALQQYTTYRRGKEGVLSAQPLAAHALQMPLTWPSGTFTLMKAAQGCPEGKVSWKPGFRKHDTEDYNAHNYFSPNVQQFLSGSFASDNILTNFCTKTQISVDTEYDREWPSGTYCIMKHGKCPANFAEGYIYWDDDDQLIQDNHNEAGGVLPDGSYGANTRIYYCCRNDEQSSTNILMPREKPFVLLRFGLYCQHVHGMHVQEVFVRWDDEDVRNDDSAGGAHPYDTGGPRDHLLYFCYYFSRTDTGSVIIG